MCILSSDSWFLSSNWWNVKGNGSFGIGWGVSGCELHGVDCGKNLLVVRSIQLSQVWKISCSFPSSSKHYDKPHGKSFCFVAWSSRDVGVRESPTSFTQTCVTSCHYGALLPRLLADCCDANGSQMFVSFSICEGNEREMIKDFLAVGASFSWK